MRPQNSSRPGRTSNFIPIQTVDLFNQPKPISYSNLGYSMSTYSPLQDPCAYASTIATQPDQPRPANRISVALGPTYNETESRRNGAAPSPPRKNKFVDPCIQLAEQHDIEGFKQSMSVAGVPALQYEEHYKTHPHVSSAAQRRLESENNLNDESICDIANTSSTNIPATSTPMRRSLAYPRDSSAKRQRTMRVSSGNSSMDGDVSVDTVKSVLRLVDDSLLYTPEKMAASTPKVLRAAPIPSPRNFGPTFAYENNHNNFDSTGGLPKVVSSTPFGMTRI